MHIQIINFQLKGVSEADYADLCDNLAPSFAAVPGLVILGTGNAGFVRVLYHINQSHI